MDERLSAQKTPALGTQSFRFTGDESEELSTGYLILYGALFLRCTGDESEVLNMGYQTIEYLRLSMHLCKQPLFRR